MTEHKMWCCVPHAGKVSTKRSLGGQPRWKEYITCYITLESLYPLIEAGV